LERMQPAHRPHIRYGGIRHRNRPRWILLELRGFSELDRTRVPEESTRRAFPSVLFLVGRVADSGTPDDPRDAYRGGADHSPHLFLPMLFLRHARQGARFW